MLRGKKLRVKIVTVMVAIRQERKSVRAFINPLVFSMKGLYRGKREAGRGKLNKGSLFG